MVKQTSIPETDSKTAIKNFIYDNYIEPSITPTPLKPIEVCRSEAKAKVNEMVEQFADILVSGEDLFLEHAKPEELDQLTAIFDKFGQETPQQETPQQETPESSSTVDVSDAVFLEKIAKREFAAQKFENARVMFNYILVFTPEYINVWIGLALAEDALGHQKEAEAIFNTALQLFPESHLLPSFAAEYYLSHDNHDKAKEIVQAALENMKQRNIPESSPEFTSLNELSLKIK